MRRINFSMAGHAYRTPMLNAFDQFECLNLLSQISEKVRSGRTQGTLNQIGLITRAVEALDEGTAERLCALCLPSLERQDADGEWGAVWDAAVADLSVDDISAVQLLGLIARVIAENLQPYLTRETFTVKSEATRPLMFDVVELPNGKSWLMRPVEAGMCRFESLLDGTLDLSHIALMNEAISVRVENENRARAASQETI